MKARVKIRTADFVLHAAMGADAPHPTSGLGGWTATERPGNVSITEWAGIEPVRLPLTIMCDGWSTGDSVEKDYSKVLRLGRRAKGRETPPIFRATGPFPYSGERFVLESTPTFADTIRNERGKLVRFSAALALMEHVSAADVESRKKGRYAATYTTKKGETLRSIAVKLYKKAEKAKDLGKLNGIRDVRRELKPGTVLRLSDAVDGIFEAEDA